MKRVLFYLLLVISALSNAQNKNIELPKIDGDLGLINYTYHSLFVYKDGTIVFENDTIQIHEIPKSIYEAENIKSKYNYGISFKSRYQVHIFADKAVNYSIIDKIKTEISSTNCSKYITYRSNFPNKQSVKIKGIKHKSHLSYYSITPPKYYDTESDIRKKERMTKHSEDLNTNSSEFPVMPPISSFKFKPSINLAIYSIQQAVIDEALLGKKLEIITVTNDSYVSNEEIEKLKGLLKNMDVILVKYDSELTYENYLKFIKLTYSIGKEYRIPKNRVIELSSEILKLHRKAGIILLK